MKHYAFSIDKKSFDDYTCNVPDQDIELDL
jgi:hypothetical protein